MKQIWKSIRGYEGLYEVNNLGFVRGLSRKISCHKIYQRNQKTMILKGIKRSNGYIQVALSKNGKSCIFFVHRLVLSAFLENPMNKPQVNHKDGNKENNKIENLEWVNASENGLHSYRELGRSAWHKGKTGKGTPTAKALIQKTLEGTIIRFWDCGLDAVREGKFESSSISRCANGIAKTHKGFVWEYA